MRLLRLTRAAGVLIFLAACCVWAWAPHADYLATHVASGALGAIGATLMLWGKRR